MKKWFLVSLLLFSLTSYLQTTCTTNKHILLRGKATSFFLIEDTFWRNANIGVEFRLFNLHSIGIDYIYFRWRYQHDSIVNGTEYNTGFNAFSRRQYLLFDYRFYPFKNFFTTKGIDPYANAFIKIGKRKIWSEDPSASVIEKGTFPIIKQNSNFSDFGIAVGLRIGSGLFGVDVNAGVVKRTSYIWHRQSYDYSTASVVEKFNETESKWVFHMRLNLYLRLFKLN